MQLNMLLILLQSIPLKDNLSFQNNTLQDLLSSLNAVISTNESTLIITGHVIYNPAYTYKFQLKTTHNGFQPIVDIASICKSVCRGMNYGHVSKSGFPCLEGRKMSEHTSLAHVPHRIFSLWHLTLTQDDT